MRGRKPKPLHLHLVEATVKTRTNKREPKAVGRSLGAPPPGMDDDRVAIWNELAATLPHGVAKATDRVIFEALVDALHNYRIARAEARTEGNFYTDGFGNPKKHPAVAVARSEADLLHKLGSEFGLTPSARARLVSDDGNADDAIEKEFFGN